MARHAVSRSAGRRRILHDHRSSYRYRIRTWLYRHRRDSHAGMERCPQRHRRGSDHGDDDGDRREPQADGAVQSQALADRSGLDRYRVDGACGHGLVWIVLARLEVAMPHAPLGSRSLNRDHPPDFNDLIAWQHKEVADMDRIALKHDEDPLLPGRQAVAVLARHDRFPPHIIGDIIEV